MVPWFDLRLLQVVIEVVIDRLRVAVLNAQNELDLVKGAAVNVQKRLHQDRHDAFSDPRSRANVPEKCGDEAVGQMNDVQDVAMSERLPLCRLHLHCSREQVLVKGTKFESTTAFVEL